MTHNRGADRIVQAILEDYEDQDLLDWEERDFASPDDIVLGDTPEIASDDEKDDEDSDECDAEDLANLIHHFEHAYVIVKYILLRRDRCVFGAIRKADDVKVVIVLALDKHIPQMIDGVPREVQLLKRVMGSEFVVELLGWEKLNEDVYALLLPFYHDCELVTSTFDSHYMIAQFMEGLLLGLKHLKDRGVAHRDIAPYNVMWNPATQEVKIIDFDLACRTRPGGYFNTCGRPCYSSPEKLKGHYYDDADVYSAGVMFWMMLTQHKHSPERRQLENWVKKAKKKYRHNPEIDLLCKMLAYQRADRISIEDALAHEFFRRNEEPDSMAVTVLMELEAELACDDSEESESDASDEEKEHKEVEDVARQVISILGFAPTCERKEGPKIEVVTTPKRSKNSVAKGIAPQVKEKVEVVCNGSVCEVKIKPESKEVVPSLETKSATPVLTELDLD